MDHATLSDLIETLERGTKLHICIAFMDNCGNRKTLCSYRQAVHDRPVCMDIKREHDGLVACYRCRNVVQRAVVQRRKPMAGLCVHGVYEYCKPVVYENRVICVIFVGNILPAESDDRERLERLVGRELLETMEQHCTVEDCARIAAVLESYIVFLFDTYGIENKTFDPLVENIKNYIRENLAYDFSIEELAADFNYTPKYLGHLFRSRTGQSIKEYCNLLKVNQAKRLLTESDLNIATIAVQVGFNSITYFDRVFHKETGLSPQRYRSSAQKQAVIDRQRP